MPGIQETPELEEHPIRTFIAGLLKDGKPGEERAQLDAKALAQIRGEITKYLPSPDLQRCIDMVLAIAAHIRTQYQSPRTAAALAQLTTGEDIAKALRDLTRQMVANNAEHLAQRASKFAGFAGSSGRVAPPTDAKAPRGSMKIGSLSFPKKL